MNIGWGAVALGVILLAGAALRFFARREPPRRRDRRDRRDSSALKAAIELADLSREARALFSRKAWNLLDVQLVKIEEAALGLLQGLEVTIHHGGTETRR